MNRTILALALIGVTSAAAAAQSPIRLSDVPAGAIHTPGIGPGYIYPTQETDAVAHGSMTVPGASMSMVPGAMPISTDHVSMTPGYDETQVRALLRDHGFTAVQDLRQSHDGTWRGTIHSGSSLSRVAVSADGVVSFRE